MGESFDDMAVALSIEHNRVELDIGEKRILGMRLGMSDEALRIVTMEMSEQLRLVAAARDLLKQLAPHEAEIRKLATRGKPRLIFDRAREMVGML
ncbi:hypothetical protein [Afipia carboxidovorans]|uniref:hypothetical protein n=1 Tax=Afipia carboxidovorans TaxID=40137 RepID=UPI003092B85A|nr:hypothetical protein CRBSH125_05790 [Afipia carboxidovorans]